MLVYRANLPAPQPFLTNFLNCHVHLMAKLPVLQLPRKKNKDCVLYVRVLEMMLFQDNFLRKFPYNYREQFCSAALLPETCNTICPQHYKKLPFHTIRHANFIHKIEFHMRCIAVILPGQCARLLTQRKAVVIWQLRNTSNITATCCKLSCKL